jgi:RNA polymerase sigma-70 factor (ECF subfamily)
MREQVEDIAQNVVLKLLRAIERSEGGRSFSSVYLDKAAHGAVVDEIRRVCRRREESLGPEESIETVPAAGGDPHRSSSAREIARGILDCLDRLSRPRRLAVSLYLNGCTVPEAAIHLRWHLKRTESLVYRGLAQLRTCLEAKGLRP